MERDKSLLTLCTAGIGVILVLWTTRGVGSLWEFVIDALAAITFLGGAVMVLTIFRLNADYLACLINEQPFDKPHGRLELLDRWVPRLFYIGILLAVAGTSIATLRGYLDASRSGTPTVTESEKNKVESSTRPSPPRDSTKGTASGVPAGIDTGSLKNLHQLAPTPAATPQPKAETKAPVKPETAKKPEGENNAG
jgi:hypothetical protein